MSNFQVFPALLLAALFAVAPAKADALQTTLKECGACHMAFPPQMLPSRSWAALMDHLDKHFGENAALDKAAAASIRTFLIANSAGSPALRNSPWLRGIGEQDTPLRITDTPLWIAIHRRDVPPTAFADPRVKTKSNCLACHRAN